MSVRRPLALLRSRGLLPGDRPALGWLRRGCPARLHYGRILVVAVTAAGFATIVISVVDVVGYYYCYYYYSCLFLLLILLLLFLLLLQKAGKSDGYGHSLTHIGNIFPFAVKPPVERGTGSELVVTYEKMSKSKHNGIDPKVIPKRR